MTISPQQLEHLVLMATHAPSVHNTQPWAFTPTADGLIVSRDRSRRLDVLDPYGRELLLSCGASLHHLEVAARALGIDATVEVLLGDEDAPEDDVARVTLVPGSAASAAEIAAAAAILHRHTHRGRFADERVPEAQLDQLGRTVEAQHALLRIVHEDELTEVGVVLSRADRMLLDTPGYADELARWVWQGEPDENRGDGLPAAAVDRGTGRAESLQSRHFDATPDDSPQEPLPAEHPAVVLLSTLEDAPHDWVQAGRALSALLLAATEAGLVAQPLGQAVDTPTARVALTHLLGTMGHPQLLLRLGIGTSVPVTPRRPVADVITPTP